MGDLINFAVHVCIERAGAVADGITVNTDVIQSAIDQLHDNGGGTLFVPAGIFVSGAVDLRPGVNLHIEAGGVLKATPNMEHFPKRMTRIEGQLIEFTPALINADGCNGLRITGEGTLDGAGRVIWDEFWERYTEDRNTRNLDIERARLVFIANSLGILIEGVHFKNSQFWNLHIYRCRDVLVRNVRFTVPDDYEQAPSTDGIDVDSSQDVLIEGCYFSVTDDCIALKGTKGPFAKEDEDSPPVDRVRIVHCTFRRGHSALTLGSEAAVVRNVTLERSQVIGAMFLIHLKLRPDTPQEYEGINIFDIDLDADGGHVVFMNPWKQYIDLMGQDPPQSRVHDISLSNIRGRFGSFGLIRGNPGQTEIRNILFKNVDLSLMNTQLKYEACDSISYENVIINNKIYPEP